MNQLVAAGPQYGSLITIGADLRPSPQLRGNWPTDRVRPYAVRYDPGPSRGTVASKCAAIAAEARKGSASPELSSIMQGEFWQQTSHEGLTVPLGINVATNNVHAITIGDETPHAILTGQSGGGKSNVLNTLIASLAYQFNPDELQINLLDYKQGVEFARYGAHPYLPHANIVGKKIDDDPEFGLAALRYLEKEIARRGGRSNEMGFTNFIELHDDPEKSWPRIVMVIDEFHKLLENGHGNEAAERMLNIVRQGRSMGVHLVLATQNVKGIASLADKYDALFTNIPMRMATVGGSMMRKDHKTDIAHSLPTHHLLVGTNSGDTESDITLWMPDSSSPSRGKPAVAAIQRRAYDAYQEKCRKDKVEPDRPFVYNSLTVPVVTASREFQALSRVDLSPRILLAQEIDVTDRTAGLRLNREPGSNVAVIGNASRRREVYGVLHSAALSLAKQQSPNQARFTVVCLDRQAATAVDATAASLRDMGHKGVEVVRPENAPAFFASAGAALDPHTEQSHYLLVYGADASQVIMSKPSEIEHAIDVGDMELNASEGTKVSAGITVLASDIKSRKSIKAAASGTVRKRGDDMVIVEQGPSGKESFFKLLSEGPGNGVHVIASYSSAASLKQAVTQGVAHQQAQHVGSYVAVGVQPMELNAFSPENPYTVTAIEGLDRRNRGIFYTRGKAPHFVRLFAGPALSDDEEED